MNKFSEYLLFTTFVFFLHSPSKGLAEENILYVGTGGKAAQGIYQTSFNQKLGKFSDLSLAAEVDSPGFLTVHPLKNILYAVARWKEGAGVVGYKINEDGTLNEFTRQSCPDGMGCHLAVHSSGNFLVTAQYGGGSVALFSLSQLGKLTEPTLFKHKGGSKIFGNRQNAPHPHWCGYSPCQKYLLVPDLGLDKIVIYLVDDKQQSVSHHGYADARAGGGPRHMRFSKDGKFIYLLNELNLTIETFSWDSEKGEATSIHWAPTLTEAEKAEESFNSAAEILVHKTGNWVYSSNRGHDSVSVFSTRKDGSLEILEKQPIRGAFPRNINFSPDGNWLITAGQHSNTISAHLIDRQNGKLTFQKGALTNVPNPTCLLFLKNR